MGNELTKEQQTDIATRVKEAHEQLKKLELTIACQIVKERISDDDVFADRLYPYLQDLKYNPVKSPIQKDELAK